MQRITYTQGNTVSVSVPLVKKTIEKTGNVTSITTEDYTPGDGDTIEIKLIGERRTYCYTPTMSESVAVFDLQGNEVAGRYGIEVNIYKTNGEKMRYAEPYALELVPFTGIVDNFVVGAVELDASVFFAMRGEKGDKGDPGADGNGILNVTKTGTSGLVDTYTITYTDATTSTFQVTNGQDGTDGTDGTDGRGIISITKTASHGLIDTYTITYTDRTTSTYQVTNGATGADGRGISSIVKTGTSGLVDTYTITLTNGETATFQVTNGMDGVDLGAANIVDNLTTGGATNVLSAEQGKVLGDMLMTTTEAEGTETTMYGNSAERIKNKGIASDGSEVSVQYKSATPYLEIYPLSQVIFQGYSVSNDYGIAFYDANKTFITGSWTKVTGYVQTFTAPQGARYVRTTLISGTTASYIKYHPIVTTQVEIIPELEDRIETLENAEVNVIDNLESSSTTDALSANQGRAIGGCIYTERGATSQTTIGQADAPNYGKGVISDGTLANTGNLAYSRYTDFTRIAGGSEYMYFANTPTIGGLAFYAEANEASFISFVASPAGGGAKRGYVPNNAKYFRVTFTGGSSSDYFKYYAMQSVPVNQAVDEAMDATQPFIGKRIAILGDSLTWLEMSPTLYNRGWVTHFRELLKFAELRNYARSGATWSHTASTQYDITEDTQSISNDNVIYNQLNRLINDVDNNGVTAPDFIFILAGTNDAWYPAQRPDAVADTPASVMSDESVWLNVKSIGSLTSIPKAMRYVAEMIWDKFPDCQVVVTTPLQSTAFTTDRREAIAESIKGSAEYLSWAVIEQDKVCDISRIRESQGYYMTYDGTHTSEAGAKMVGEILASQLTAILGR